MQPTRAVLVSLLVVFVLLSALLAKCLQTSRLGRGAGGRGSVVIPLEKEVYSKKLDCAVGTSEDTPAITQRWTSATERRGAAPGGGSGSTREQVSVRYRAGREGGA